MLGYFIIDFFMQNTLESFQILLTYRVEILCNAT